MPVAATDLVPAQRGPDLDREPDGTRDQRRRQVIARSRRRARRLERSTLHVRLTLTRSL